MEVLTQIMSYLDSLENSKRSEMQMLHDLILEIQPSCKQWFTDGKNSEGKVVSNPNVGYGNYTINYADGSSKDFFQVGISANTTGISIYILGKNDKEYLKNTFANSIGKASVTGYCIKFKTLKAINLDILKEVLKYGFED